MVYLPDVFGFRTISESGERRQSTVRFLSLDNRITSERGATIGCLQNVLRDLTFAVVDASSTSPSTSRQLCLSLGRHDSAILAISCDPAPRSGLLSEVSSCDQVLC